MHSRLCYTTSCPSANQSLPTDTPWLFRRHTSRTSLIIYCIRYRFINSCCPHAPTFYHHHRIEPSVAICYHYSAPHTLMPMIRHPDSALSIGFEVDFLVLQISSCTSIPQQQLTFRIARPNVDVTLSLEYPIPPDIILSFELLSHIT
jgi:hypothetical protein